MFFEVKEYNSNIDLIHFIPHRNRIALIQKEEERARKKIEQTKDRAVEILALRNDTQKRVSAYKAASGEVKQLQQIMLAKNREQEEESKRARQFRLDSIQAKKKGGVVDMLMEKKYLTQMMIHEQEKEIQMKQKRRMEIKRMEEEARQKKEQERLEKEAKVREFFAQKLAEEASEAKRAERLVRELEKKEKEWIAKLRNAQLVQEDAFDQLETALHKDSGNGSNSHTPPSSNRKATGGFSTMEDSPKERFRVGGGTGQQLHQQSKESYTYDEERQQQQQQLGNRSASLSEMNMSGSMDGMQSQQQLSSVRPPQQRQPGQGQGTSISAGSQNSRASSSSRRGPDSEEAWRKSAASAASGGGSHFSRPSASGGSGSARGSSAGSGIGASTKKKAPTATGGKKAY